MPSISGQPAAEAVIKAMEIAAVAGLVGVGIVGAAVWDAKKRRKNPRRRKNPSPKFAAGDRVLLRIGRGGYEGDSPRDAGRVAGTENGLVIVHWGSETNHPMSTSRERPSDLKRVQKLKRVIKRKNPSSRFDRCVRKVRASAARRGYPLKSAEGVCAAAGRRRYGKKKFQQMAAAGRRKAMRKNPPLMEGSAAADLQQSVAPYINKWGPHRSVRYSETGSGDLRVVGDVSDYPMSSANTKNRDSVGYVAKYMGGHAVALQKIAARHGFRFGYSDGGDALLFRKL